MGETAQENSQINPLKNSERVEFDKNRIRDDLFAINLTADENQKTKTKAKEKLAILGKEIAKLKIEFPQDQEISQLSAYHADLIKDLKEQRSLNLDSSFNQILSEMQTEIQKSGVRIEKPDQTIIPEVIQKLKAIGINPSYIVTKGNKNAKTIVYFMQIHNNPGLDEEMLEKVGKSQQQIFEAIKAGVKSGLIKTFYAEATTGNKSMPDLINEVSKEDLVYNMITIAAEYRAKHELGNKIDVVGMENNDLLKKTVISGGKEGAFYRRSAHNVVLADYVTENLNHKNQSIAFMSLGAAHESSSLLKTTLKNPLPISHVLAYNNFNVIVVDAATPYYHNSK